MHEIAMIIPPRVGNISLVIATVNIAIIPNRCFEDVQQIHIERVQTTLFDPKILALCIPVTIQYLTAPAALSTWRRELFLPGEKNPAAS